MDGETTQDLHTTIPITPDTDRTPAVGKRLTPVRRGVAAAVAAASFVAGVGGAVAAREALTQFAQGDKSAIQVDSAAGKVGVERSAVRLDPIMNRAAFEALQEKMVSHSEDVKTAMHKPGMRVEKIRGEDGKEMERAEFVTREGADGNVTRVVYKYKAAPDGSPEIASVDIAIAASVSDFKNPHDVTRGQRVEFSNSGKDMTVGITEYGGREEEKKIFFRMDGSGTPDPSVMEIVARFMNAAQTVTSTERSIGGYEDPWIRFTVEGDANSSTQDFHKRDGKQTASSSSSTKDASGDPHS